jgi:hypothetical protein
MQSGASTVGLYSREPVSGPPPSRLILSFRFFHFADFTSPNLALQSGPADGANIVQEMKEIKEFGKAAGFLRRFFPSVPNSSSLPFCRKNGSSSSFIFSQISTFKFRSDGVPAAGDSRRAQAKVSSGQSVTFPCRKHKRRGNESVG